MLLREPVSASSRVLAHGGVTLDASDGGYALVEEESGERTALSPAAAVLWGLLDGEHTVAQIADALDQPLIDVIELIRRLRATGLAGDAPADPPATRA